MNEKIKKVTTVVKEKWTGFSKVVKILIIAVPIALIAIIIILANLLNHKDETVLYSGLTTEEAGTISAAITDMGITDVRMTGDGDIIVPSDQADYLRMQLSVQGYPKTSTDYDIWNDGVDLWSTDTDKREVQRQQREARIAATLAQLEAVKTATVNLDVPKTKDYVITEEKETPTCSVVLTLREDKELTNAEVRAIFRMVATSVDGLTNENISVMDTLGRSYEWVSEEEEANGEKDASGTLVAQKRLKFQCDMQAALMTKLKDMLTKMFGENGYAVNVTAILNYDQKTTDSTEYVPLEGTNTGVVDHDLHIEEKNNLDSDGNVVGVTPNGDQSPDYPTIEGVVDGQDFYYKKDETQYDVTNIKTNIVKDGYSIDKLSVGVAVNTTNMTETEQTKLERLIAAAAGTDMANVAVYNMPFALTSNGGTTAGDGFGIITKPVDTYRNILLIVVIALGVILLALLIVSLFMSKSRKRKIRRRQEQALEAAQAAAAVAGNAPSDQEQPEEVNFNIASLTEEAGKDSRETILKREIADFAKTSPEIVAQIIKNMMREDN